MILRLLFDDGWLPARTAPLFIWKKGCKRLARASSQLLAQGLGVLQRGKLR